MPDHKRVVSARDIKIQKPAEIFLAGFFIRLYSPLAQLNHEPLRHIVPETGRIDEIVPRLAHVEGRGLERDNRSDFFAHARSELRKLVPWGIFVAKFSAMVWPMSARVARVPRFAPVGATGV